MPIFNHFLIFFYIALPYYRFRYFLTTYPFSDFYQLFLAEQQKKHYLCSKFKYLREQ